MRLVLIYLLSAIIIFEAEISNKYPNMVGGFKETV